MLTAIIATIIDSFSNIFWTKSLKYNVWWKVHDFLQYPVWLIISLYFIYVGINYPIIDIILIGAVFLIMVMDVIRTHFDQKIYKVEKMSAVIPYTNLNKIVVILVSFFLFSDVSVISLFITISAIIVIILFSIDFKNKTTLKNILPIILTEISLAADILLWWWVIMKYSEVHYFIFTALWWAVILTILAFIWNQFRTLKWLPRWFWLSRGVSTIGWFSWFLSLTIIKELWLSVSILLSFLGIGVSLFLSYLVLKDTPSNKDLLLTLIVTVLVGLWFYFK